MAKKVKLSPPWIIFYNEIEALFKEDPDIRIEYDDDEKIISLYVDNEAKAEALTKLLPIEKIFGGVTLQIRVIPANGFFDTKASLFETAFDGNPIFTHMVNVEGIFANTLSYMVFRKEVVQFYTDNLGDIDGLKSTLYEDIARDVFSNPEGVYFCTDSRDPE